MYKSVIMLFIALSAFSCRQRDKSYDELQSAKENLFALDSVEVIRLLSGEAEPLEIEGILLARPTTLAYHHGGFLLLNDRGAPKQLLIVDLLENTFYREIGKGRANNELLYLWDVIVNNEDIFLSSLYEMKVLRMTFNVDTRRFFFSESVFFPQQFLHCLPVKEGFLTFAPAASGNRFVQWSKDIVPVDTIGTFPVEGIENLKDADNAALQSDAVFSSDGTKMAVSYKNIDYIDLYRNGTLIKRIRGPRKYDVTVRTEEIGNGFVMTSVYPQYFAYRSITATKNGFWAGYIGLKAPVGMMPTPDMNRIREIFYFDWDGNLRCVYTFDEPIDAFAIDESSEIMYCLISTPEPSIVKYHIGQRMT